MTVDEFLVNEYSSIIDLLDYHQNLFEISDDVFVGDYLNIRGIIFDFYKTFCLLDSGFENKLDLKLYNDIVSVFNYSNSIDFDKICDDSYTLYTQTEHQNLRLEEYKKEFLEYKKNIKFKFIKILNIKLFIFDHLMWYRANHSDKLAYFLISQKLKNNLTTINIIEEYSHLHASQIQFEFEPVDEILKTKYELYEKHKLERILSTCEIKQGQSYQNLKKLIDNKQHISILKDIEDKYIEYLVSNIEFQKYQMHDLIIKEGDMDEKIYFLFAGECRVTVGSSMVGKIKEKQIFGEFAALDKSARSATIRANKESIVMSFDVEYKLFDRIPCVFSYLYRNITNELIKKIKLSNDKKF
ncbi:MAG: cyclic nucleotide-binding domain-containing protein [Campylobacterota bacterium]|nr:cyclic nucleotide-binding domain-containing protein [Campylobacterota bacterium]